MCFRISLLVVLLTTYLGIGEGHAQIWKYNTPKPTKDYIYKTSTAKAKTEEEAINKAIAKILYHSALANGMNIQLDSIKKVMETGKNLNLNNVSIGLPINLVCYKTSPAVSIRGVEVIILCQVARKAHTKPDFKPFNCSEGKEINY
jgi:hypothetical protein